VVSDRSKAALDGATRIARLADEMKLQIRRKAFVLNMADPEAGTPGRADGFDAVYAVRRSGMIQARMTETESLLSVQRTDHAFSDIAKAVDSERKRT
jgi:CO dehydrogenase nickel-insertion accessory protein CooC1